MEKDIKLLSQVFPTNSSRVWICVNEGGDLFTPSTIGDDFDVQLLKKHARAIYEKCDEKLPHTHKYVPFRCHMGDQFTYHYKDWESVNTSYLKKHDIPITMEAPERLPTPVKMKFNLSKKRSYEEVIEGGIVEVF